MLMMDVVSFYMEELFIFILCGGICGVGQNC